MRPDGLIFSDYPGSTVLVIDKSACRLMVYKFQESWKGNGNTDLIRAIFDNCEYNENGFVGEENLKRLTNYPKGSRF